VGGLERERPPWDLKTLRCRSGPDPKGSGAGEKHGSGRRGDGSAASLTQNPREDENQEGKGLSPHLNREREARLPGAQALKTINPSAREAS
jgi:hypothetical protein